MCDPIADQTSGHESSATSSREPVVAPLRAITPGRKGATARMAAVGRSKQTSQRSSLLRAPRRNHHAVPGSSARSARQYRRWPPRAPAPGERLVRPYAYRHYCALSGTKPRLPNAGSARTAVSSYVARPRRAVIHKECKSVGSTSPSARGHATASARISEYAVQLDSPKLSNIRHERQVCN